jgi:hypothetical protein
MATRRAPAEDCGMAKANIGDLKEHRGPLLDALRDGRPDLRRLETAWPTIESAIRQYRTSLKADLDAEPKRKSKADLRSIIRSTSKTIHRLSDIKGRQLKWICLELGKYRVFKPKYKPASEKGFDILQTYLQLSKLINRAAEDALVPVSRNKKFERNAAKGLIIKLDALWQAIRGIPGLDYNKRKEYKYFKSFALMATNCANVQNISQTMFSDALRLARNGRSDESEASEQLKEQG